MIGGLWCSSPLYAEGRADWAGGWSSTWARSRPALQRLGRPADRGRLNPWSASNQRRAICSGGSTAASIVDLILGDERAPHGRNRLGRGRACLLRKGDVEIPSDLYGIIYTEMDAAGAWKPKLTKELKAAGLTVDSEIAYSHSQIPRAPALVAASDERNSYRFLEFFTAQIRNPLVSAKFALFLGQRRSEVPCIKTLHSPRSAALSCACSPIWPRRLRAARRSQIWCGIL